jgi:hypothetical protein
LEKFLQLFYTVKWKYEWSIVENVKKADSPSIRLAVEMEKEQFPAITWIVSDKSVPQYGYR